MSNTMPSFRRGDVVKNIKTGKLDRVNVIVADMFLLEFEGADYQRNWVKADPLAIPTSPIPGTVSNIPNFPSSDMINAMIDSVNSSPIIMSTKKPIKQVTYKIGDRVSLTHNPRGDGEVIFGTVVDVTDLVISVLRDDGHEGAGISFEGRNTYAIDRLSKDTEWRFNLQHAHDKKKKDESIKIKQSELDRLVLPDADKKEIISVLKQAEHHEKIFDSWGLGETIEYGRGMGLLFHGPPGTGKTWAANCIAKAVSQELLVVNAANIQSSEPGGANRNIEAAFKEATTKKKVLFLDECDSLITSRNDVGMVLSSEINTLLTEIEKFEGFCILATNRIDTLDEALERRLALIIEFSDPDFKARKEIWTKLIPKKFPLDKAITFDTLAEHKLTGGQIKNVLLQAARLAAADGLQIVSLEVIERAVTRIHDSKGLMGKRSRWVQRAVEDYTKG